MGFIESNTKISTEVTKKNYKAVLANIKLRDIEDSIFQKPKFPADLWSEFVENIESEINAKSATLYRLTVIKHMNQAREIELSYEIVGLYTLDEIIEQAEKASIEKSTADKMLIEYIREKGVMYITEKTELAKQYISDIVNDRTKLSISKIKDIAEKIKCDSEKAKNKNLE